MEESLFQEIYLSHYERIYNYAYSRILRRGAAEDVTAEVFISLWEKGDSFDPAKGRLVTWLYAIAANKVTDWLRKSSRCRETPMWDVPDVAEEAKRGSLSDSMWEEPENSRCYRILRLLSDEEREFLLLRYSLGLTNEEIAKIKGGTANSVSARYYRLLKKCRRLADDGI